ncbi:MAG: XRE family transcriptional regulator [Bdellovibrionota bacterium]
MKNKKNMSLEEIEINRKIDAGQIKPVHIPRLRTSIDILKYQLCSEIIKYKKDKEITQKDIAMAIDVNKSEISKIFSYQLDEFSSDRLLLMIEALMKSGADIRLEKIFEEVRKKAAGIDKKIRLHEKEERLNS